MDLSSFPLPPPWQRVEKAPNLIVYRNQITGDESIHHPLEEYFVKNHSSTASGLQDYEEEEPQTSSPPENQPESPVVIFTDRRRHRRDKQGLDFICEWKEIGFNGNTLSYTMTLTYYPTDLHFEIRFDGVDAVWKYSKIEGHYGPLDLNDLFIGAKIRIFDRHLTITAASSDVCKRIDEEEVRLRKRIALLQQKIESVGMKPVIRREAPKITRHITRGSGLSGTGNLRKLLMDVNKLVEQLGELGLSHHATSLS